MPVKMPVRAEFSVAVLSSIAVPVDLVAETTVVPVPVVREVLVDRVDAVPCIRLAIRRPVALQAVRVRASDSAREWAAVLALAVRVRVDRVVRLA